MLLVVLSQFGGLENIVSLNSLLCWKGYYKYIIVVESPLAFLYSGVILANYGRILILGSWPI